MATEKEVQFSAFIGSLTHEIITRLIGSCVTWEIVGDELFMAAKVPIAGEGSMMFAAGFKIEDFERKDMSGVACEVFDKLDAAVLLIARRNECKTTESSSSEN